MGWRKKESDAKKIALAAAESPRGGAWLRGRKRT